MKINFIAKPDTWFDDGTQVTLIDDYRPQLNVGLFEGYKDGKIDQECCNFDEFDIIEEKI